MFNRQYKYLIVTANNLRALEEISMWIHTKLGATYFIGVETFPNCVLYRVHILLDQIRDRMVIKQLTEHLKMANIKFFEDEESC